MRTAQTQAWWDQMPTQHEATPITRDGEPLSSVTRAFFTQPKSAREGFLRRLSEEDRNIVLEEWIQTPGFCLADLFDPDLSRDTFHKIERCLNGSEKWNIPKPRLTFYVAPNPEWEPDPKAIPPGFIPRIEVAMRRGERQHLVIDRPTPLSSANAIKALLEYGPTGKFNHLRGALMEIDHDTYIAYEAKAANEKLSKSKKKTKKGETA